MRNHNDGDNAAGTVTRRQWLRASGGAVAWALAGAGHARAPTDPLQRAALLTPRALGNTLLDLAQAGGRIVAVGERGTVLVSDDGGQRWRQVACPVSVTLTAITFADDRRGWAVGHGGVVLHSTDGGLTWARQLDGRAAAQIELAAAGNDAARRKRAERLVADGADKPWLAVHSDAAGRHLWVVGAYGTALGSADGGASWFSLAERLDNPRGLHLNTIAAVGASLWLAGEQGLLLRSDDGGRGWTRVPSPYDGSWFAAAALDADRLLLAGLRGNAWVASDRGASIRQARVPMPVSLNAARVTPRGDCLLVNQAGGVLVSRDAGASFEPLPVPAGAPATAVLPLADGSLVATTFAGMARWPAPALALAPRT